MLKIFILLAAIARVGVTTAGGGAAAAATTCTTGSRTWTGGNTIVVFSAAHTSTAETSVTQSVGSNTYTLATSRANGTTTLASIWTSSNITGGTFTVKITGVSATRGCAAIEYSGVAAIGVAVNSIATGSASPLQTCTTQDDQNWCVGGFAGNGTGTFTGAGGSGTLQVSSVSAGTGTAAEGMAMVDNGPITPSSSTAFLGVTDTDTTWALVNVELRSTTGGGGNGPCSMGWWCFAAVLWRPKQ